MQTLSWWRMGIRRRYSRRHLEELKAWTKKQQEIERLNAIAARPRDLKPKLVKR